MAIIHYADVIYSGEKGVFDLRNWVASRTNDKFENAAITVAELWHGVDAPKARIRQRVITILGRFLARLPIILTPNKQPSNHARIWALLEATGKMIGYYDIIVAATALERDSEVATFNRRHFAQSPG